MSATGLTGQQTFPIIIDWSYGGYHVQVCTSWDYKWTVLHRSGQKHWARLDLPSGKYDVWIMVDGVIRFHPNMPYRDTDEGSIHILSVNLPVSPTEALHVQSKPQPEAVVDEAKQEVLVPITFKEDIRKDEYVYVVGSWDDWKRHLRMEKSCMDHYLIMSLSPGIYPYKYIVNGKMRLNRSVRMGHASDGMEGTNVLEVKDDIPHNRPLDTGCKLLGIFLEEQEHELTKVFKFRVGSLFGSISPDVEEYPCTDVGYMLTNGFFNCARINYLRNKSWAGTFKPSDMVIVDGRHCQIRKEALYPLTRVNLLLDNYQMKKSLLLKYERSGKYPPYFHSLFWLLENPPSDFDSNARTRMEYLDQLWKAAALAYPSQRMHFLINMSQFYKQLSEEAKKFFASTFNKLLARYSDWQKCVHIDDLLEAVYMDRRHMKVVNECETEPVQNTILEMTYFLRIFYVHGPEHTMKEEAEPFKLPVAKDGKRPVRKKDVVIKGSSIQYLQTYVEFDMMMAHYYEGFLADLITHVREYKNSHDLLGAVWEFYCDSAPPLK